MTEGTRETRETPRAPALMLPLGKNDWENGHRWHFLQSCEPILAQLGWTIGVELKTSDLNESWVLRCINAICATSGRVCLHPPAGIAKGLGDPNKPIPDKLLNLAQQVPNYIQAGLEAVTIHLAPAQAIDPPENAGMERYRSPIGPEEMLEHITRQVEPLKQLNEMMGGVLHIENVDITNFRGGGYRLPNYLALQTGCLMDLAWLSKQTGVKTTFDSEHFYCSVGFLNHDDPYRHYVAFHERIVLGEASLKLADITGYYLERDQIPRLVSDVPYRVSYYIREIRPSLYHLGAATCAFTVAINPASGKPEEEIATHLPIDINDRHQLDDLQDQLRTIMNQPEVTGAVVEVCGQLDPDKYSKWSPRPHSDELAKYMTYLNVIRAIEIIVKGE